MTSCYSITGQQLLNSLEPFYTSFQIPLYLPRYSKLVTLRDGLFHHQLAMTPSQWASKYRFQVGDTSRFKYRKDSVMLVSEEDYKTFNSTHPFFFSNSGSTNFKLSRAFLFHEWSIWTCEKGERMVIIVMSKENGSSSDHHSVSFVLSYFLATYAF